MPENEAWRAWENDVVLSDGSTLHVRSIEPGDAEGLVALHTRLSSETIYSRFFSPHPRLSEPELRRFVNVDHVDRMALVATGAEGAIVAVARYDRHPGSDWAETAFLVEDAYQGRGIGTLLLEHLAAYARQQGIFRFVAETLLSNAAMRRVFRNAGFREVVRYDSGVLHIEMDLEPTPESVAAMEDRDRRAVARSMERLLRPGSVAVVGAGRRPGTIGHEILASLVRGGFSGHLWAVNPHADEVHGVRCYPSVAQIPGPVDMVVVSVAAPQVAATVVECGRKGVGSLVVISAGFAERGPAGAMEQKNVVRLAHSYGMRVVGPNCMGVLNTDPDVSLNATFAPDPPVLGSVGFGSQSGGLGIAILGECSRRGLGLSTFVSMGNKADVSGNDLLQYWESDPATTVGLFYLESIGNPRAFRRIAARFSRTKPIVAVKAGRSASGARSASSHTAALASPDAAVDALFRSTGVIRVERLEELFDTAVYLSAQEPPRGPRVAVVGNSGGPGTLAADACEARGLEVPSLSAPTQDALRAFLPPDASVGNPVDMVASAAPEDYERTIRVLADDAGVDSILVIFTPPIVTRAEDVAAAVARAAGDTGKPVVANFLASGGVLKALQRSGGRPVPQFSYPESAADALARALSYRRWKERPPGEVPHLPVDRERAVRVVHDALSLQSEGGWLPADAVSELLGAFGVAHLPVRGVADEDQAAEAAAQIGFPVAVKAAGVLHKSDVGGVVLGLEGEDAVRAAFRDMSSRLGAAMTGGLVQAMAAPGGVETIVGGVQDPAFGPLVVFGSGGTLTELVGDRRLASAPLTDVDAAEMISEARVARLLRGWRGAPAADLVALEELVLRVSQLVVELPQVAELDLNPVLAGPQGAAAVDYRVRVAPWTAHPELGVRRLR